MRTVASWSARRETAVWMAHDVSLISSMCDRYSDCVTMAALAMHSPIGLNTPSVHVSGSQGMVYVSVSVTNPSASGDSSSARMYCLIKSRNI